MADGLGGFLGAAGIGSAIGQAVVQLELSTAKYQAELKAMEGKTLTTSQKMGAHMQALGGLAKAGLAVAGVAVVAFGANAIRAASDLGEAVNKSNVIFGKNARAIEAWAETGADAFGLSKTAALDAAAGFGAMLETAGIATDDLDDMSMAMVQLAGDMASFNNIDPTEALEKLRSGLAGEAEPLRRFGVFLSEAAVQQEAYASGIAKVGEELTEAEKVQARYNIIFEQTVKQQGDFARTADSLPNQLRSMKAEFENVSAEVGTALLPVVTTLVGAFGDLIPLIKVAADNLDVILAVLVGFAAIKFLPGLLFNVARALEAMGAAAASQHFLHAAFAVGELGASIGAAAVPAAAFGLAFAGLTAAVAAWDPLGLVGDTDKLRESMEANTEAFGETDVVLGRVAVSQNLLQHSTEEVSGSIEEMQQKAGLAAEGMLNLAGEMAGTRQEFADMQTATKEAREAIHNFAGKTEDDLEKWSGEVKESFETFILTLEESDDAAATTARGFAIGIRQMLQDARDLSRAMKLISQEKWVNDEFIAFLSEQGPEWLIGFADMTERQQRKAQDAWELSTRKTDAAKESLDKITGVLDDMGGKKTKHVVEIVYQYTGYDPSKPGMTQVGGKNNTPSELQGG